MAQSGAHGATGSSRLGYHVEVWQPWGTVEVLGLVQQLSAGCSLPGLSSALSRDARRQRLLSLLSGPAVLGPGDAKTPAVFVPASARSWWGCTEGDGRPVPFPRGLRP